MRRDAGSRQEGRVLVREIVALQYAKRRMLLLMMCLHSFWHVKHDKPRKSIAQRQGPCTARRDSPSMPSDQHAAHVVVEEVVVRGAVAIADVHQVLVAHVCRHARVPAGSGSGIFRE